MLFASNSKPQNLSYGSARYFTTGSEDQIQRNEKVQRAAVNLTGNINAVFPAPSASPYPSFIPGLKGVGTRIGTVRPARGKAPILNPISSPSFPAGPPWHVFHLPSSASYILPNGSRAPNSKPKTKSAQKLPAPGAKDQVTSVSDVPRILCVSHKRPPTGTPKLGSAPAQIVR